MNFPPFLVPYLGNGMMIGLNGVIHVLISHGIAIGAIAMMALGESRFGGSGPDGPVYTGWKEFNRSFLRFNVFTITVLGATTGAGIWFTIMPLASLGQSHMIRVFFWAWFFEYFVFFAEVAVLLVLYFRWDTLWAGSKRALVKLGTLYAAFAMISGVSITAILGFMLTPGAWLKTGSFWDALLNPSFVPQAAARMAFSFVIGALVALGAVTFWGNRSFRPAAQRLFGKVLIYATLAFAVSLFLYLEVLPRAFSSHIPFAVLSSHFSRYPVIFSGGNILLFLILFACAFAALHRRNRAVRGLIVPALAAIVLLVTQFERTREFIRGPYLMPGHMYANSVLIDQAQLFKSRGLSYSSPWYNAVYPKDETSRGAYLFAQNCGICHSMGGLNNIADRVQGRTVDGIYVILGNLHQMVPFMPPFAGSERERGTLASFLYRVEMKELRFSSLSRILVDLSKSRQGGGNE
jgi:hypothetical protein